MACCADDLCPSRCAIGTKTARSSAKRRVPSRRCWHRIAMDGVVTVMATEHSAGATFSRIVLLALEGQSGVHNMPRLYLRIAAIAQEFLHHIVIRSRCLVMTMQMRAS